MKGRGPAIALTCCGKNVARVTHPEWNPSFTEDGLQVEGVDVEKHRHIPGDRQVTWTIRCVKCGRVESIRHERIHSLWEDRRPDKQVRVAIADVP